MPSVLTLSLFIFAHCSLQYDVVAFLYAVVTSDIVNSCYSLSARLSGWQAHSRQDGRLYVQRVCQAVETCGRGDELSGDILLLGELNQFPVAPTNRN